MAYSAVTETRWPLLDEIWCQIFEYLPADDRKNVRLTCRRFYDIANYASLLESEEHVFPGNVTIAAIGSLVNSSRKIWNLKFVQVNLTADQGFLSFFSKQGASVRSLTFDRCSVTMPEIMKHMIVNCANLRSFAMNIDCDTGKKIPFYYALKDFNSLCGDGIIRQHVSSFTLTESYYSCKLTNAQFVNFFTTFPNIKELYFQFYNLPHEEQYERSSAVPPPGSQLSFSGLHLQLANMRHQLEKLELCFNWIFVDNEIQFDRWNKISLIEMENLKELSIRRLEFPNRDSLRLLTSFPNFRHLTVFDCKISSRILEEMSGSDVVRDLLNTARELYSLKIRAYSDFPLTADCLQALVESRLRKLHLSFFKFMLNDLQLFELIYYLKNRVLPNCTLKRLKFPSMDESCFILFASFFRGLEKLVVNTVSENILTNVFQYQTKLRHLTINVLSSVNNLALEQWLSNTDRLSHQLNYLTNLHLINIQSLEQSKFFLIQFKYPKLQALSIMFANESENTNVNDNLFWQSIQKFTNLEYLDIQFGVAISPEEYLALCCSLPKLRYFLYFNKSLKPFGMLMFHALFQQCPSLRLIIHGDPKSYSVKYFKDIGTNTVKHLPWPLKENLSIEFIYEGIPQKYLLSENYLAEYLYDEYLYASSDDEDEDM